MKNLILVIIFSLIIFSSLAQTKTKYYYYENKTEDFILQNDLTNALLYNDSALSFNLPICDYYVGYYLNDLNGNKLKSNFYLKKLIAQEGLTFYDFIERSKQYGYLKFNEIDSVKLKEKEVKITTIFDSINKQILSNYNLEYISKLVEIYTKDQIARKLYLTIYNSADSNLFKIMSKEFIKIDSANFYELKELYLRFGLPFLSLMPKEVSSKFLLVLGHNLDSDNLNIRKEANTILMEYKKKL